MLPLRYALVAVLGGDLIDCRRGRRLKRFRMGVFLTGLFLLTGCIPLTPPPFPTAEPTPFILVTDEIDAAPSSTPFQVRTPTKIFTKTATSIPLFTETPLASATSTEFSPTKEAGQEESRPQYTLVAKLDYANRTLDVEENILYTNQTGIMLNSLVLVVEANRYSNVFVLKSLAVNNFITVPTIEGARMEIPLGAGLQPKESITLDIIYTLNIPAKHHEDVFGYLSDYQMNIVNWYPFVAPYTHLNSWLLHEPSGVGEHLVYETSDFDVTLKVEGEDDLVVAASALGTESSSGTRYQLEGARAFVFSVSSILSSQTIASEKASVTSFYYPNYEYAGEGILEAASQAIDIYSDRFAPYPYESLSIVQTHLPDGMEYDGLIFMGSEFYSEYDGTMKNNLTSIGVHEVSHQWWFGLVGSDQALEPWLDEALSLYSERIYYETLYPFPVKWWWRFRVTWFSPSGWVDTSIYDGYAFRGYTDAVYLRGAQFLEEIRFRIGEKAFNTFLKDYASSYAHKIATSDDFFDTLDRNTDVDYSDIVASYFSKP
jgi:hypothetical protein